MGGKKSSLTDWPDNLKDVIDWFLRVGEMDQGGSGFGNQTKLPAAVKALVDYESIKEVLDPDSIAGTFGYVAEGLRVFIGYNPSGLHQLDGSGIGLDTVGKYASSYGNQAQWNCASWNADSTEAKICASIFLGSMPILYFGLTYIYWKCTGNHGWQNQTLQGGPDGYNLSNYMSYMEYDTGTLSNTIRGQKIATLLGTGRYAIYDFKEVSASNSSTYPEFLKKLQEHGQPKLPNSAANAPMYALYTAASKYLQSKVKFSKIMDLPRTKSDIANTLKGYREAVKALNPGSSQKLSTAYLTLLSKIKDVFNEAPPASPSSSGVAPVAGTLTTLGLRGGAAAAYLFNLGGAKTLVTNLLRIG
ncbi:variant erythrocyte surface antigen-1 family protein [Babesia caballi]|uniref:Variant erythrocyte surface antigen-1 family protein n=1 Tax=Babesia caballi TaxID=5871 RepID=A0AAV4LSH7_BABCB|nr:variant erythrocyte surface antigen-1 family protein [Babesia caballi]